MVAAETVKVVCEAFREADALGHVVIEWVPQEGSEGSDELER